MPIHSVHEISKQFIADIKMSTKVKLMEMALTTNQGTAPSDWVFRDVWVGGSGAVNFRDLDWLTTGVYGTTISSWGFDASLITAEDLSNVLASGETINKETYIGIYGFFHMNPQGGYTAPNAATTASSSASPVGDVHTIKFTRGSSCLDIWNLDQLYAYPNVVGFTDRPLIWEENQPIKWEIISSNGTLDNMAGLRCILLERRGDHISPDEGLDAPYDGGFDPMPELTVGEYWKRINYAWDGLRQMVINAGLESDLAGVEANWIIREALVADDGNDTDNIGDFDLNGDVRSGIERWGQDFGNTTICTAGTLTDMLASTQTVADQAFAVVVGVTDLSEVPYATAISTHDGSGMKDFYEIESMYAYRRSTAPYKGLFGRPTFFKQNQPIHIKAAVTANVDTYIAPLVYIIERKGENISEA